MAAVYWRQAIGAVLCAWKPLVSYEILISLLRSVAIGPLAATLSYRLIELTGESVIGNTQLAHFLLSPQGMFALVLGLSVALGLVLVEYSGLILLVRGALHGAPLSVGGAIAAIVAAAPRLFVLAVVQTVCAIVVALPFLGLATLTYWLLLSGTDVNYYLYERPPRFWVAVGIGGVSALGLIASTAWFFLRWALAVPACVLDGQSPLAALRSSRHLMRGRAGRLLSMIVGWQLLEQAALVGTIAGLDQLNHVLFAGFEDHLTVLVWSAVALLLIDTVALQLVGAMFAIGRAFLITFEYERASRLESAARPAPMPSRPIPTRSAWHSRAAILVILLVPAASLLYAVRLSRAFVQFHPVRVTAHRAGSRAAWENSIAALRLAIQVGADDVEIDVQQTADGQVVLMHDRDLRRMTGDGREVNDVTLAELASLRLRDSRGPSDESIPTLAQFLDACDENIRLNVELKDFGRTPGLALAVLEVLRTRNFTTRAGVSAFQLPPLLKLKSAEPKVPVGMILSAVQGDVTRLPVDFLSLNTRLVSGGLVRRAHHHGMQVHVWTVNDPDTAVRLLDLGCDNLITSDPKLIREVVDAYAYLGETQRILLRLRRWMRD